MSMVKAMLVPLTYTMDSKPLIRSGGWKRIKEVYLIAYLWHVKIGNARRDGTGTRIVSQE